MKIIKKISILLFSGIALMACNQGMQGEKTEASEAKDVMSVESSAAEYEIDVENSIIEWKGTKPTGEHVGTVSIKQGKFMVQDENIVTGKFTIDMTSIVNNDLTDAEWNKKLVDHLNSSDFFNTAEFPEATFEITSAKAYDGAVIEGETTPTHWITGNLTVKGITKSITFSAIVRLENGQVMANTSQFIIDRTDWDVRYQSRKFFDDLKDKFIYDEIGLKITVIAKSK